MSRTARWDCSRRYIPRQSLPCSPEATIRRGVARFEARHDQPLDSSSSTPSICVTDASCRCFVLDQGRTEPAEPDMCNVSPITGLASNGSSLRGIAAELEIYTCSSTAHRLTERSVLAVVPRAVAARHGFLTWESRFSPSARSERDRSWGSRTRPEGTTALSLSLLGHGLCVLRSPRVRDMVRSNTRPLPICH